MSRQPDFRELIGGEEVPAEELERLRRVHDLLVAAGPPPDLPERLARAPRRHARIVALPRPRLRTVLGLAAAAAVAVGFGIGFAVGNSGGYSTSFSVPMHGLGRLAAASASIDVGPLDAGGNWPLRVTVRGLPTLPANGWYALYLTKKGMPAVTCGTFRTSGGVTRVRLTAPYRLTEYDGWIITAHRPGQPNQLLLKTSRA